MVSEIRDLGRQAYRTLNEDGLVDVGVGLGLSFAALYIGLSRLAGSNTAAWSALAPIMIVLLLRGLRERFVYPRIGYARIRPASPAIIMMATLNLLLVAGLVVTAISTGRGVRPPASLFPWLFRALALAGAATLALMGRRTGFVRFYIHSAVIVVAALASAAFRNTDYGLILILGLPGFCLLVTGAVCFFLFLRRHPASEVPSAIP
jgi:drug/metabolite transporter (DMT)-like permease